jgi:arylformamidase
MAQGTALYRGYDRAALDAQYNNRGLVPDFANYFERWKISSATARAGAGDAVLDVPYGPTAMEKLDIFRAAGKTPGKPPILVFIHGGYWRAMDKSDFSYPAPPYVDAGITYVSINYGLTPAVTLDELIRQARAAVEFLYRNPQVHGGDVNRLYVSGHSAGGHLAPLVMTADWPATGLPADVVKGAVAISGLYDLEPIRLSYLNEGMNLDEASVRRNSPIHGLPPANRAQGPLVLSVGGDESPEFRRQQADYAAAWRKTQRAAAIVDAPGRNHFSVIDAFADPQHALFRVTRDLVLGGRA